MNGHGCGSRALLRICGSITTTVFALFACSGEPDQRIATPQDTVVTLLEATHLRGVTDVGPLSEGRPEPDIDTVALCFWDYDRDDPISRAMGEFVAGMLAARQGQTLYRIGDRFATAETGSRLVHFRKTSRGWHIELRKTVPTEIRAQIVEMSLRRREPDHEMP